MKRDGEETTKPFSVFLCWLEIILVDNVKAKQPALSSKAQRLLEIWKLQQRSQLATDMSIDSCLVIKHRWAYR